MKDSFSIKYRKDAPMPCQEWRPFPTKAIVLVSNAYGEKRIGPVYSFWWGYKTESGQISEEVIVKARRLDRPSAKTNA